MRRESLQLFPQINNSKGFTLLETIVALVLLATTGLALFSWLNSNLATLNRLDEFDVKQDARMAAFEYLKNVNPMIEPKGSKSLPPYEISWQAKPTGEIVQGKNVDGGSINFMVGLYEIFAEVKFIDGQSQNYQIDNEITAFSLLKTGYKYK